MEVEKEVKTKTTTLTHTHKPDILNSRNNLILVISAFSSALLLN